MQPDNGPETPARKYDLTIPRTLRDRLQAYSEQSGLLKATIVKAALDDYLRARGH